MLASLMATAALLIHAVPSERVTVVEELPFTTRIALEQLRADEAAKRGGAGAQSLTLEDDATILVRHVRDRVSLPKILLPQRKPRTAKTRWQDHLKKLPRLALDALRSMAAHKSPSCSGDADGSMAAHESPSCSGDADQLASAYECELQQRLDALELELSQPLKHDLVKHQGSASREEGLDHRRGWSTTGRASRR